MAQIEIEGINLETANPCKDCGNDPALESVVGPASGDRYYNVRCHICEDNFGTFCLEIETAVIAWNDEYGEPEIITAKKVEDIEEEDLWVVE